MAVTNFSPLLGLALPTTGDLSGTWGTTVNDSITSLLDSAVAGTTTLSTDVDVTLSTTNGAANQARSAVLLCTGSRSVLRTITAPAQSKAYVVINQTTGGFGVKVVGAGPTTGVTIANGDKALIAWNGSDFTVISSTSISNLTGTLPVTSGGTGQTTFTDGQLLIGNTTGNTLTKATLTAGSGISVTNGSGSITIATTGGGGTVTSVGTSNGPAPINGLTLTGGPITGSGTVTLGGGVNVSTITTGTLPVANGGTGVTSAGTSGNVLTSNGTAWVSQAAAGANVQEFTSGGTWTKPSGAKFVYVEVWAGGGGGRGGAGSPSPSANNGGGQGGGGGGYSSQYFVAPQLGSTETVTVGSGGPGGGGGSPGGPQTGGAGGNGGTSNFGTYVFAYGGRGDGGQGGFAWASGALMSANVGPGTPGQAPIIFSQQILGGITQQPSPANAAAFSVFGGGAGGQTTAFGPGYVNGLGSFYGGGGGGAGSPGSGSPGAGAGGRRQGGVFEGGGGAAGTPGPAYFMGGGGGSLQSPGASGNVAGGGGGGGAGPQGSTGAPGGSGGGGLVVVYSW